MKPQSDLSDPRIIKALTHPLRISILSALEQRTASPSELADELDAPLGNVSYHVRQLSALGLIKLVKKTPRRGAIEHYYQAVGRAEISDDDWAATPEIVKEAVIGAALGQVGSDVRAAATAGGFGLPDAHLTRQRFRVDAKGWSDLSAELAKTLDRVRKISEDSKKRLAKGGGDGDRDAGVVLMLFEASEAPSEPSRNGSGTKTKKRARAKS